MNKNALLILSLAVCALLISGCQATQAPTLENTSLILVENEVATSSQITGMPVAEIENSSENSNTTPVQIPIEELTDKTEESSGIVIEKTEGDLIHLKPEAVDPDQDEIKYFFTSPVDASGKWQTKEGDAGKYVITVTASDGILNTSQDITLLINRAKKAPVIECMDSFTVKEGDMVQLNCNIYDPEESDQLVIDYSGFMKGPSYQTGFEDAGEYTTVVKARNPYKEASKIIKIKVLDTNRQPVIDFDFGNKVTGVETDILALSPKVSDPDGDKVTISYGEPFDSTGVWKTKIGDAGTKTVSVVATDGTLSAKKDITVELKMKNTAPVIKSIAGITVLEGETVRIPVDVVDREGDKVTLTVKGWMNDLTYTTNYEDAGSYSVTLVANDGEFESTQTFSVTVLDKNRAPVFKIPA